MIKIEHDRKFKKHFRKRIATNKKLRDKFKKHLKLFIKDPNHPLLEDHKLKGEKKEFRSFSITGDVRVLYKRVNDTILLYDIGSHRKSTRCK